MSKRFELNANKWYAEIDSDLAANKTRQSNGGKYVYNPLNDPNLLKENPFIYGSPILLPANRTADGKFIFEEKEYRLPITEKSSNANLHGSLFKQKFTVKRNNNSYIKLIYENKGEIYPFPFILAAEYYIENNSFYQKYEVMNIGKTNMPFTFALHTSFVEPKNFSVPIAAEQERNGHNIPTGEIIPLGKRENESVIGTRSKGSEISGYYISDGNTACIGDFCYKVSENFDCWILFNGKGQRNLLCVEPQCGKVNGLNIEGGYKIIKPNEKEVFLTQLYRKV